MTDVCRGRSGGWRSSVGIACQLHEVCATFETVKNKVARNIYLLGWANIDTKKTCAMHGIYEWSLSVSPRISYTIFIFQFFTCSFFFPLFTPRVIWRQLSGHHDLSREERDPSRSEAHTTHETFGYLCYRVGRQENTWGRRCTMLGWTVNDYITAWKLLASHQDVANHLDRNTCLPHDIFFFNRPGLSTQRHP